MHWCHTVSENQGAHCKCGTGYLCILYHTSGRKHHSSHSSAVGAVKSRATHNKCSWYSFIMHSIAHYFAVVSTVSKSRATYCKCSRVCVTQEPQQGGQLLQLSRAATAA